MSMALLFRFLTLCILATFSLAAQKKRPPTADPFADPAHDFNNPLRYIASNVLAGIAVALVLTVAIIQSYFTYKYRTKWMLSMVIGAYTFALGLAMRFGLHASPDSKGIYTVEYLFVVLSPCAFIAAEYVLLGRLAQHIQSNEHLLVSPKKIAWVFITSDIVTFLIQAAGGSLSIAAQTAEAALKGSRIFLAGLAIQLLSFSVFTCIFIVFMYRVSKTSVWTQDAHKSWFKDWRALAGALVLSSVGILIRSAFRTAELSEGFAGPLTTNEGLFYGLDTLPLFIAIVAYVPFWPGRFISNKASDVASEDTAITGGESAAEKAA